MLKSFASFLIFALDFQNRYTQALILLTSELWATTGISRVHNFEIVSIVKRRPSKVPHPQPDVALSQGSN